MTPGQSALIELARRAATKDPDAMGDLQFVAGMDADGLYGPQTAGVLQYLGVPAPATRTGRVTPYTPELESGIGRINIIGYTFDACVLRGQLARLSRDGVIQTQITMPPRGWDPNATAALLEAVNSYDEAPTVVPTDDGLEVIVFPGYKEGKYLGETIQRWDNEWIGHMSQPGCGELQEVRFSIPACKIKMVAREALGVEASYSHGWDLDAMHALETLAARWGDDGFAIEGEEGDEYVTVVTTSDYVREWGAFVDKIEQLPVCPSEEGVGAAPYDEGVYVAPPDPNPIMAPDPTPPPLILAQNVVPAGVRTYASDKDAVIFSIHKLKRALKEALSVGAKDIADNIVLDANFDDMTEVALSTYVSVFLADDEEYAFDVNTKPEGMVAIRDTIGNTRSILLGMAEDINSGKVLRGSFGGELEAERILGELEEEEEFEAPRFAVTVPQEAVVQREVAEEAKKTNWMLVILGGGALLGFGYLMLKR